MQRLDELEQIVGGVSRETFDSLVRLDQELARWNSQINLVAPSTLKDSWKRHVLDSAQLYPLAGKAGSWVDLGAGGGFPGLVMAILRNSQIDAMTSLVESNRKKAGFLRHIVGTLGLSGDVQSVRIEDYVRSHPAPDVVSARALAPLHELLAMIQPWLGAGSRALFHKGRDYGEEIKRAPDIQSYDLVVHQSATDADSVILDIRRARRD